MKKIVLVVIAASVLALFGVSSVFAHDESREKAEKTFKNICSVCHGPKGEGKKGLCPSLKDSQFVTTAPATDIKNTIHNGRAGKEKRYKDYPSPMPGQKQLKDDELEALAKYLKEVIQKK